MAAVRRILLVRRRFGSARKSRLPFLRADGHLGRREGRIEALEGGSFATGWNERVARTRRRRRRPRLGPRDDVATEGESRSGHDRIRPVRWTVLAAAHANR